MFEFDAGKLIIIAIAALIFIGPKDLPRVMRQVGQIVGRLRRMGADFQAQFMEAMNEAGVEDVKADVQKLNDSARIDLGFDPVKKAQDHVMTAVRQIEAPVAASAGEMGADEIKAAEEKVTEAARPTLQPRSAPEGAVEVPTVAVRAAND